MSFLFSYSLLWRVAFGVLVASLTLIDREHLHFDSRLLLSRGKFLADQITVVRVGSNLKNRSMLSPPVWGPASIVYESSDEFFWDEPFWGDLLQKILNYNPKRIGVTFYFSPKHLIGSHRVPLFTDQRIIWAVPWQSEGFKFPPQTLPDRSNVGELHFNPSSDGLIRYYQPQSSEIGDFFEKILGYPLKRVALRISQREADLTVVDAVDILKNKVDGNQFFSNRIVLIGRSLNDSRQVFHTIKGPYSRLALSAVVLNNYLNKNYISVGPVFVYILYFMAMALLALMIMLQFPHKIALIFLIFVGFFLTIFSIYLFDYYSIWLPIWGIWIEFSIIWVLFLGYSLNKMERDALKNLQEKRLERQLEELKINFISLISHDLKTPLAKIQALVNRLKAENPHFSSEYQKIEKYSQELNRYIQNVLKLLQVESKKFSLNIDSVDVNQVLEDVVEELQPLIAEKNIVIKKGFEPLFPIEGDQQLLKEVFLNLVQNAIQYSKPGGEIVLTSEDRKDQIVLSIEDQGVGIPSEELNSIFNKFYRGKAASLAQQGSGLGLYLVRYFVELHHGQIYIDSEVGRGTKVQVVLPVQQTGVTS
ncbi:MAG: ATP-binding protein [Bdellovibrionaceae bacterium]|nr:ATP-binding protein [Pseudobdellovibrionaceae bacterium]MDW8189584.1 ATP-binding protein [Pseudobdellovibrionaceae bacterium]